MGRQKARHTPFTLEDYSDTTELVERLVLPPTTPLNPSYLPPQIVGDPVLLRAPSNKKHRGSPPGGSAPVDGPTQTKSYRRSPIPGLVRVGFVLIQLVCFVRVVCLVLNVQETTPWFVLLVAASDLFVEPVRLFAATLDLSGRAGTPLLPDLEFAVVILAYGLLSWLLVHLLRALLNH